MSKILISGLINTETTVKIKGFPIEYFPIDYPFFGVNTGVSGVAYNLAKALKALDDDVSLISMTGNDFGAEYVIKQMKEIGVSTDYVKQTLSQTPNSVVLYDEKGKRQIYCDLKDVQDMTYDFEKEMYDNCDVVIACNINFNRDLLKKAKEDGKLIATDVHVLGDIEDAYNKDFMQYANILFLSDENIKTDYREFLMSIEERYENDIIVLGMGDKGALMYVKEEKKFYELPAVEVGEVVNTVGAGDALFSAFIHYYAKGVSAIDALKKAEIFASYKIGFDGAANGFTNEKKIDELEKTIG
jgi:acarbose 7IV-phosphotransferase